RASANATVETRMDMPPAGWRQRRRIFSRSSCIKAAARNGPHMSDRPKRQRCRVSATLAAVPPTSWNGARSTPLHGLTFHGVNAPIRRREQQRRKRAAEVPPSRRCDGRGGGPVVEVHSQPGILGNGEELLARDRCALRLVPADQRFCQFEFATAVT